MTVNPSWGFGPWFLHVAIQVHSVAATSRFFLPHTIPSVLYYFQGCSVAFQALSCLLRLNIILPQHLLPLLGLLLFDSLTMSHSISLVMQAHAVLNLVECVCMFECNSLFFSGVSVWPEKCISEKFWVFLFLSTKMNCSSQKSFQLVNDRRGCKLLQ